MAGSTMETVVAPRRAFVEATLTPSPAPDRLHAEAARVVNVTFLSMLLKAMRKTVPRTGLLDGGRGGEVFRAQLDTVLVDRMSESFASPLAEAIVRQVRPGATGPGREKH